MTSDRLRIRLHVRLILSSCGGVCTGGLGGMRILITNHEPVFPQSWPIRGVHRRSIFSKNGRARERKHDCERKGVV